MPQDPAPLRVLCALCGETPPFRLTGRLAANASSQLRRGWRGSRPVAQVKPRIVGSCFTRRTSHFAPPRIATPPPPGRRGTVPVSGCQGARELAPAFGVRRRSEAQSPLSLRAAAALFAGEPSCAPAKAPARAGALQTLRALERQLAVAVKATEEVQRSHPSALHFVNFASFVAGISELHDR